MSGSDSPTMSTKKKLACMRLRLEIKLNWYAKGTYVISQIKLLSFA
jgi:hypothetical protein